MAKNRVKYNGALSDDIVKVINHNFRDVSLCTTQLDITSSVTLTDVPGMITDTLEPGVYEFVINARVIATANTGISLALKWGTASMITAQTYQADAKTASGVVTTAGTTATDATLLLDSATGVVVNAVIHGVMTVALAGTVKLQAAQHTSNSDTVSVYLNSKMEFKRIATN